MEKIEKEKISNICEDLYKYCLNQIPQVENNKIIWILNGSTLCNILYNVESIDDKLVSKEFNDLCFEYIRQPKGDIDITYIADRPYKFNLNSKEIKEFQNVSKEQRTYNFVDSNSELTNEDLKQLCKMTTKNGLSFYAKKPQYIFIYKFKELLDIYNKEILTNNINLIISNNNNIINDLKCLYNISLNYCSELELIETINKLPYISNYLNNLYNNNYEKYNELLNKGLSIITTEQKNKKY